jgi:hypothetical protein
LIPGSPVGGSGLVGYLVDNSVEGEFGVHLRRGLGQGINEPPWLNEIGILAKSIWFRKQCLARGSLKDMMNECEEALIRWAN